MNKTYSVKAVNSTSTIATFQVTAGKGAKVFKVPGRVNLELTDIATGKAPQKILVKRVGNDLHVALEENGDINNPDLVLQGFYDHEGNKLVGVAQDNQYYEYVSASGDSELYISSLAENSQGSMVLGGDAHSAAWWGAEHDWGMGLPWGLAVTAAAFASSGGGSDGGGAPAPQPPSDTTAPAAPTLKLGDSDGDDRIDASGMAEPGSTVTVTWPDGTTSTVTTDPNGNWLAESPTAQDSGTVTAVATDPAGNASPPTTQTYTDTTPPTAPTITVAVVTADDVVNAAEAGGLVTISGTTTNAADGDTVTLVINGVSYTGTVTGGTYSIDVAGSDLAADSDTTLDASVTTYDAAGNPATGTVTHAYGVDTVAPTAPTITVAVVTADDVVNAAEAGGLVTISGTTTNAADGDTVTLVINGVSYTGTVTGGTYSIDVAGSDLAADSDTTLDASVTTYDAAGNPATGTVTHAYGVDTVAPTAPIVITAVSDDTGEAGDFLTSDTSLTVTGTVGALGAGEVAQISNDGGATWTDLVVTAGTWSYVDGRTLADGAHAYEVQVVDGAGNVGATMSQTVTVDASAPAQTVTITGYTDDAEAVTGSFGSGTTTNDTTPMLTGTLSAGLAVGEVVRIYEGTTLIGTAGLMTATTWAFALPALVDGSTHSYTAVVEDQAGNQSTASGAFTITIDAQAPTATIALSDNALKRGDTATVTISFSEAVMSFDNSDVTVSNGTLSTLSSSDGGVTWTGTFTPTDGIVAATNAITLGTGYTDQAGNTGTAASSANYSIDTQAPTFTSGSTATVDENSGTDQIVYEAAATDTTTVNYSLSGNDAAAFTIDSVTGVVTLSGNPDYEAQSSYTFDVTATDGAGNVSTQTVTLAINNLDEVAPTITSPATATAIAENSGAGQVVYTATMDDSGDVSSTPISYSLGGADSLAFTINASTGAVTLIGNPDYEAKSSYSFTVTATDAANNASTAQAVTLAINDLDDVAPTQTVAIISYTDDIAPRTGDFGSGTWTNDPTLVLHGTLSAGLAADEKVFIYNGAGLNFLGEASSVDGTNWTFNLNVTADSYGFRARVVDAAGNEGALFGPFIVGVDMVAPTQTAAITSYTDNVTAVTGTFGSGTTTNDTTPVLSGTLSAPLQTNEWLRIYDGVTLVGSLGWTVVTGTTWTFPLSGLADGSSHSYTVVVEDVAGNVSAVSSAFALTVDTQAPTITSGSVATAINENSGAGQHVYVAAAADATAVSYGLGGADASAFTINASTGEVTLTGNPNFEAKSSYSFTVTATDAAGNVASKAVALAINNINEAPVNTIAAISTNEDVSKVITGLSVTDDASSGTMTVTLQVTNGVLNVAGGTASISGSGTTTVTLTGTLAAINSTLSAANGVTYMPTEGFNGTATLTMTSDDGGNTGSGDVKTDTDVVNIDVVAVNDAPVNSMPGSYDILSYSNDPIGTRASLSVTDDALENNGNITTTVTVQRGTVSTSAGGVTINGSGTATMTLTGTVAAVNAALAAMTYTTGGTFAGFDTLSLSTNDNGNTGGGALIDTDTVQITDVDADWDANSLHTPDFSEDNDTYYGLAGNDTLVLTSASGPAGSSTQNMSIDFDVGLLSVGSFSHTIDGFENIVTGSGNDFIWGDSNAQGLNGGDGNDTILGDQIGSSNDTLYGGNGNDYLQGDGGADSIIGGAGIDTVNLKSGTTAAVTLTSTAGAVVVSGGSADTIVMDGTNNTEVFLLDIFNDRLIGGGFNETVYAGGGTDTLAGATGNDGLFGEAGADSLLGGAGNDWINPGAGNDAVVELLSEGTDTVDYSDASGGVTVVGAGTTNGAFNVTGAAGTDVLTSTASTAGQLFEVFVLSANNDSMFGSGFNETIYAGAGNDTIRTGSSSTVNPTAGIDGDRVDGGAGSDWIDFSNLSVLTFDMNNGTFVWDADNIDTLVSIENVLGTDGNDSVVGDAADNYIHGGGNGHDTVFGGAGNDTIIVNADQIGSNDQDYVDGGEGDNYIVTGDDADTVFAGSGNDTIDVGTTGTDLENDFVNAGNGNNVIYGGPGSGDNTITSGSGNDRIFSGSGLSTQIDSISSGAGNDTVSTGAGADRVSLGAGVDVFIFDADYVGDSSSDTLNGGVEAAGGFDAIVFEGSGLSVNFTAFKFGDANIESFERIDLTGSGNNSIQMDINSLLEITDKAPATATLVINGNAGDAITATGGYGLVRTGVTVNVDLNGDGAIGAGESFVSNGSGQVTFTGANGTQTYYVYQNTSTFGTLLVDADMTRTIS